MPAVLYRHTDPGAPQVTQNGNDTTDPLGDLRRALIAILIDGYGDRTPVGGWTIAFDDPANNKIVFRQKDGEVFMRVDDNYFTSTASIRGYTSMTDIDTGEGAFPTVIENTPPGCAMPKRWSNTSSPSGDYWDCIVDSEGQYIWWFPNNKNNESQNAAYFFGKLDFFYNQPGQKPIWLNCVGGQPSFAFAFQDFIFRSGSSVARTFGASEGRFGQGPVKAGVPSNFYPSNLEATGQIGDAKYLVKWYVDEVSSSTIIGTFPKLLSTIQEPVSSIGIPSSDNRTIVTIAGQNYYVLFINGSYRFFACDVTTG